MSKVVKVLFNKYLSDNQISPNCIDIGNYGRQKGDPEATISSVEQQNIAVEAIKDFLAKRND